MFLIVKVPLRAHGYFLLYNAQLLLSLMAIRVQCRKGLAQTSAAVDDRLITCSEQL